MARYKNFLGLGIAGNFALHLDQAGEAEDFKDVITADEAAPKGMFPFYLPIAEGAESKKHPQAKEQLYTYPLSAERLQLPKEALNVQAEPEVGLICELEYVAGKITSITPTYFGAYNDASIRVKGANKISDKKNWGAYSKGFSAQLIEIDKFEAGGIMDNFSICSFLRRDNTLHTYGEDVELTGYSYFYTKLLNWIENQINTQEEFGPLEPLAEYIEFSGYPKEAIISIGATRYSDYGEHTFLQKDDDVLVVLYDHTMYTHHDVLKALESRAYSHKNMSILSQKVY